MSTAYRIWTRRSTRRTASEASASATRRGTSGTWRGRTAPSSTSAVRSRGTGRPPRLGAQRRGSSRLVDVHDGMAAADADLVAAQDLPRVGDRRRADLLRHELQLELLFEAHHGEVLRLDRPARVVGPAVE